MKTTSAVGKSPFLETQALLTKAKLVNFIVDEMEID